MKVLLLTLQEDPPSLDSYDSPKHSSGKEFSRNFKDFVKRCLQKDPRDRFDCAKLLKHRFLQQAVSAAELAEQLRGIPNLGEERCAAAEGLGGGSERRVWGERFLRNV